MGCWTPLEGFCARARPRRCGARAACRARRTLALRDPGGRAAARHSQWSLIGAHNVEKRARGDRRRAPCGCGGAAGTRCDCKRHSRASRAACSCTARSTASASTMICAPPHGDHDHHRWPAPPCRSRAHHRGARAALPTPCAWACIGSRSPRRSPPRPGVAVHRAGSGVGHRRGARRARRPGPLERRHRHAGAIWRARRGPETMLLVMSNGGFGRSARQAARGARTRRRRHRAGEQALGHAPAGWAVSSRYRGCCFRAGRCRCASSRARYLDMVRRCLKEHSAFGVC